jgi:PTH2 family peptidyl-tRNA hydrolase
MFYSQLANGIGLISVSLSGLLAPKLTERTLNSILNQLPYISSLPTDCHLSSDWGKVALFSVFYIGTMYIGLSNSKEFAKYSITSRLLFPVMASVAVPAIGLSTFVFSFTLLDLPCALWCKYELENVSKDGDRRKCESKIVEKPTKSSTKAVTIKRGANTKMILVVNTDLKMRKGKIAAQCAHAAVGVLDIEGAREDPLVIAWQRYGCAKVALRANFDQMKQIGILADQAGIRNYTVTDAGRTQIASGSETVCAVGPFDIEEIDKITGRSGRIPLKLL